MTETDDIKRFLGYSLSQKALSLVITEAPEASLEAMRALKADGFTALKNISDLEKPGKHYLHAERTQGKFIYDLAREYGSGQITLFDSGKARPVWITPHYQDSALVVIIEKSTLTHTEEQGLPLRSAAGLALQFA